MAVAAKHATMLDDPAKFIDLCTGSFSMPDATTALVSVAPQVRIQEHQWMALPSCTVSKLETAVMSKSQQGFAVSLMTLGCRILQHEWQAGYF